MKILRAAGCLLALLAWAPASQAACPTSHVKVWGSDSYPTTPSFDHPYVKYDLPAGTVYSNVTASMYTSDVTLVEASDDFWLEGPASLDPISFNAILHLTGTAGSNELKTPNYCSSSGISGGLKSGAAEEYAFQDASQCVEKTLDKTISLPLQKLPGEVFPLTLIARAITNSDMAHVDGVLTFSVPANYAVRSCQGYHSLPTPASNRSWGDLKATYR